MKLFAAPALILFAASAPAQELPWYQVRRAASPVTIDAKLDDAAWKQALPTGGFHFRQGAKGTGQQTVARMLWDDDNLYVAFLSHDRQISSFETKRHGPVSKDDCVEIFLSPDAAKVTNYYTFEINAIGTMLNRCKTDWWKGPPTWEPEGVRYKATYHGLLRKDESPSDEIWVVEMAIPFRNFAKDAPHTPPRPGDVWRLNLNRTGGVTNRESSTWSPLPEGVQSFHTPQAFGWVRFVDGKGSR